jgi:hypothetical protein
MSYRHSQPRSEAMELNKTQSKADTAESVNELAFDELSKVAGGVNIGGVQGETMDHVHDHDLS